MILIMKKNLLLKQKLSTLLLSIFLLVILHTYTYCKDDFLNYANGGGRWLISKAVPEGKSYKWHDSEGGTAYYTSLYEGSPGICQLFFSLHKATGNDTFLIYGKGNAQWLMDMAVKESGGYKWQTS